MKFVISPAKTLDYQTPLPTEEFTKPAFLPDSRRIMASLRKLSPADLSELMHISDKLAEENWQRNRKWKTPFTTPDARQAIYAFKGDVYLGLDAYSIPTEKLPILQELLRILSGLYGLLRPMDLILPYRLEMGTPLPVENHENLYQYWKEKLTRSINKDLKKGEILLNLASKEYFSALDPKALKGRVVTPEFKDYHQGQLKVLSLFAKKARGMMVRYLIDHNITDLHGVKAFDYGGYQFDENLSTEDKLVFTR